MRGGGFKVELVIDTNIKRGGEKRRIYKQLQFELTPAPRLKKQT